MRVRLCEVFFLFLATLSGSIISSDISDINPSGKIELASLKINPTGVEQMLHTQKENRKKKIVKINSKEIVNILQVYKVLNFEHEHSQITKDIKITPATINHIKTTLQAMLKNVKNNKEMFENEKLYIDNIGIATLKSAEMISTIENSIKIIDDNIEIMLTLVDHRDQMKWKSFKEKYSLTVYSQNIQYNYFLLSGWQERIEWENRLNKSDKLDNAKLVGAEMVRYIHNLAVQSANGIYTKEYRSAINAKMLVVRAGLRDLENIWGLRTYIHTVLDRNDNILTSKKADEFLWKLDYLNWDKSINQKAIESDIAKQEKAFCFPERREFIELRENISYDYLWQIWYQKQKLNSIVRNTKIRSKFLVVFPFKEIQKCIKVKQSKTICPGYKVPKDLIKRLQRIDMQFCQDLL